MHRYAECINFYIHTCMRTYMQNVYDGSINYIPTYVSNIAQ